MGLCQGYDRRHESHHFGLVSNPSITAVEVNVWNDAASAYSYVSVPVTAGTFTATLDIYKGDNWINAGAEFNDPVTGYRNWFGDHAGVYTDTGTVWVPNISITGVTTADLDRKFRKQFRLGCQPGYRWSCYDNGQVQADRERNL